MLLPADVSFNWLNIQRGIRNLVLILLHQMKHMSILNQIAEYLFLKKRDPNQPRTQWMKYMHGINRLSILLFLLAMIILAIKLLW